MKRITRWDDIQPGCVFDVCTRSRVAKPIRHFTGREDLVDAVNRPLPFSRTPNHSGLVLRREADGHLSCLEALSKVEVTRLDSYREEWDRGDLHVFLPSALHEQTAAALQHIGAYEGMRYGWLQILNFTLIQRLRQWFGWEVPPALRGGTICSELQLRYLRQLGFYTHSNELAWCYLVPDVNSFSPAAACYCKTFDRLPATL